MTLRTTPARGKAMSVVAPDPHGDSTQDEASERAGDAAQLATDEGQDVEVPEAERQDQAAEPTTAVGAGPDKGGAGAGPGVGVPLLRFSLPRDPRLAEHGIEPLPTTEAPAPAKAPKGSTAFERGVAALAQYKHREGHLTVPRAHVETIVIDDQEHAVKLGVFLSNTKTRRGRLTPDKLTTLANLGLNWT